MTIPPVSDHLEVSLNGQPEKLFMSYALLNRLTVLLGGPDNVPLMAGDPDMQEKVLLEIFTKREKKNVVYVPESLEEIAVPMAEVDLILDWVGVHITDFFLQATEKALKQALKNKNRQQALQATVIGLQPSPSPNSAA